ncbi:hypothetical protein GCM10020000_72430 [Streptomyces olivoverticillatus]
MAGEAGEAVGDARAVDAGAHDDRIGRELPARAEPYGAAPAAPCGDGDDRVADVPDRDAVPVRLRAGLGEAVLAVLGEPGARDAVLGPAPSSRARAGSR